MSVGMERFNGIPMEIFRLDNTLKLKFSRYINLYMQNGHIEIVNTA